VVTEARVPHDSLAERVLLKTIRPSMQPIDLTCDGL